MNTIFSGSIALGEVIYDYSGIYTRQAGMIVWKSVVRSADVVCRPSGTFDDALSDEQVVQVIRELIEQEIAAVVGNVG